MIQMLQCCVSTILSDQDFVPCPSFLETQKLTRLEILAEIVSKNK